MTEISYPELQALYGGRYVARRRIEVVASAETYDQLVDELERAQVDWPELIIEFVELPDAVGVY